MIEKTQDRPDTIIYSTVINAWAKQGNALRAEAMLERMTNDYKSGNQNAKPNLRTFNSLMDAWAKSTSPEAIK